MQFQEGRHEIRLIDYDNKVYTRKKPYSLNLPSTFPAHRTNKSPQKQTCRKVVTLLVCVPDKGLVRSLALQSIHAKALHNIHRANQLTLWRVPNTYLVSVPSGCGNNCEGRHRYSLINNILHQIYGAHGGV